MKNVLFTLFAIALAGVAAIAATTAMLNSPVHHIGPPPADKPTGGAQPPSAPPTDTPAPTGDRAPAPIPDADRPAPGGATKPTEPAGGGAKPAGETGNEEPEADKDPYEGIAPEDLPPDLQYDADSSVSFPTNT